MTEQRNPAAAGIDARPVLEILEIINGEDHKVASSVAAEIPRIAQAVEGIVAAIENGGRLFYIGAGSSGRLGVLDAAECPPTFNVPPELVQGIIAGGEAALARATEASEDDPELGGATFSRTVSSRAMRWWASRPAGARRMCWAPSSRRATMGALTIGISCTPDSELSRAVDIPITPLPGPEVIAGSTRMRAGTATKLVLNMFSTATMIRLGYVYGNLMVNVQPKNTKLEDRARRIVSEAAEVSFERAAELLAEARGSVPTAILMARSIMWTARQPGGAPAGGARTDLGSVEGRNGETAYPRRGAAGGRDSHQRFEKFGASRAGGLFADGWRGQA